jgi:rhomboid protease GluP
MTSSVVPGEAVLPPGPPPLVLAVALDLVTRYRLRLTDSRDSRLGLLGGDAYLLGAAAWTGRRAAFVGFYRAPDDPDEAARDLDTRLRAAEAWGNERLGTQGAERCDVLLIALGRVAKPSFNGAGLGGVQVGALAVDPQTAEVQVVVPVPSNLPSAGEVRAHARAVLAGRPVPTLAAVDLAERQVVAGGYAQPARHALSTAPVATYTLIGIFVVVWLMEQYLQPQLSNSTLRLFAFGALANNGSMSTDWWRFISSGFLHSLAPLHLLFNGLSMFYVGRIVEQLYGRLVLIGVFLLTAAAGGLFWVGATSAGVASATGAAGVGASGGIMGLIGVLAVLGRLQGRDVPVGVVASLRQYALTFLLLTVVLGFFLANVNNWAHVGGFLAGAALGLWLPPRGSVGGRDLRMWERVALGAVIAVGVVALGVAVQHAASVLGDPTLFLTQPLPA